MRKMTNDEFIEKSKSLWDNLSYGKVNYVNSHTKVILTCLKHGDFEIIPNNHLGGQSCKFCGNGRRKVSVSEFFIRANDIHADEYIYNDIVFDGVDDYVNIVCRKHGDFRQKVNSHLKGQGCPTCYGKKPISNERFVELSVKIYFDKYDYSLVDYKNTSNKVRLICKKHNNEFSILPSNHLNGQEGCSLCYKNKDKLLTDLKEIHNDRYIYNMSELLKTTMSSDVQITCKIHGEFSMRLSNHIYFGYGCQKCAGNKRLTREEYIKKCKLVHGDKYDYSKVEYICLQEKIEIVCREHGSFFQKAGNHINLSQDCPHCSSSKGEKLLINILESKKIKYIHQHPFEDCVNKRELKFDFYLEEFNVLLEYDGIQHYEPVDYFGGEEKFKLTKMYDEIKNKYCLEKKIPLYRIPYNMKEEDINKIIDSINDTR